MKQSSNLDRPVATISTNSQRRSPDFAPRQGDGASCQAVCDDAEIFDFLGHHLIASYVGCDSDALLNHGKLLQALESAIKACGATLLKSCDYAFENGGLTAVLLLSESHASIHTYPEYNACFVDLFTCGEKCKPALFDQYLRGYLKPAQADQKILVRHKGIEEPSNL